MKNRAYTWPLLAAAWLMAADATAQTSPIEGTWAGELEVQGTRLPLVFHVTSEDGALSATMDSPLQGVSGIPVDSVTFADAAVVFRLLPMQAVFEATLAGDSLTGEWRQGGLLLPLILRRATPETAGPRRPQHPVPPFPYRSEEVRFRNEAAGITLAGTLTLPEGRGPFPAVALVTGSGPQDRDETLLGHKPFLVLSDHLTRAGVAVLRYDDRGVAESGGDFSSATSVDFAGDAAAAAQYLRSRPEINAARVGLIGHSEGGLIAPLVATGAHGAPTAELGFIVLLAGPALPGDEILRLQGAAIALAGGATQEQREAGSALQARLLEVLRVEEDAGRRRQRLLDELKPAVQAMTPAERLQQGIPAGQEEEWAETYARQIATPWFRTFVTLDPRPVLRQVNIPTLALFGALDLQVPPPENEPAMLEALTAAPARDITVLTLPGLNHLFQTATTGAPSEYGGIEETFAPAALEAVSSWILERFGAEAGPR